MTLAMEMARRLFLPLATEGLEEEDEAEANEQRKICMYFFSFSLHGFFLNLPLLHRADPAAVRMVELQALKEMGFEEEEAMEALRKAMNLELTIEWLLEQRGEKERNVGGGGGQEQTHIAYVSDRSLRRDEVVLRDDPRRQMEEDDESVEGADYQDEDEQEYGEERRDDDDAYDEYVNNVDGRVDEAEEEDVDSPSQGRENDQKVEPGWENAGEARDWYAQNSNNSERLRQFDRTRVISPAMPMGPGRMMPPPMRPRMPGAVLPGGIPPMGMPGGPTMPIDLLAREKQLSSSLWIGNVSPKVREEELRALFVPFGEIVSLKILRRSQCAFVNYSSPSAATAAKRHIQGKVLRDMRLEINFSKVSYPCYYYDCLPKRTFYLVFFLPTATQGPTKRGTIAYAHDGPPTTSTTPGVSRHESHASASWRGGWRPDPRPSRSQPRTTTWRWAPASWAWPGPCTR